MFVKKFCSATAMAAALGITMTAHASSHREAPAIAEDQFADNTDVYTFISPQDSDNLVIVANYVPLLIPQSGPNFYKFSDNVAYDIHFDNDGDAKTDMTMRFRFTTRTNNGDTFLYNTGPVTDIRGATLNVQQSYDVQLLNRNGRVVEELARDVPVAPWNVGNRSFPDYDAVATQAIFESPDGYRFFAGPRDEPFFVDLNVFDLLGVGGFASTDGVNVMSIVVEVPIEDIGYGGSRPTTDSSPETQIVGVHATASRRKKRILRAKRPERNRGQFVQVSRLAVPLVNEVVNPLKDKDKFNRSRPEQDLDNIAANVLFPELADLLRLVLGAPCIEPGPEGRGDLVAILSPNGTRPADLLRINITEGQSFAESSFPNGRKLEDDVLDILATVICLGPAGLGQTPLPIGDGVDANDLPFLNVFPYVPSPQPPAVPSPPL